MSSTITNAFIKEFEAQVHEAYQRLGSKLRPCVRNINNVRGSTTVFQKVGKGTASTKVRNAAVTAMSLAHSVVECSLTDHYAGDWIDRLDELKLNINERQILANAGAYALGRKTDDLIVTALNAVAGGRDVTTGSAELAATKGMNKSKVLAAFEKLGAGDVPDDGERCAIVGWKQWSELMAIDEFANADYIGTDELPWQGTQAKRWLGSLWFPHSGLTKKGSTTQRQCFWFHKNAVGLATGQDITTDITWHGDHAAHFVNSMMSMGAKVIDDTGIVRILCNES